MSRSSATLSSMQQRPQVARPCEDKRLMKNGKMAEGMIMKHKVALKEAVAKNDTKKAAAIRQTISSMENSEIYKQYSGCQDAMKTYGVDNSQQAARAHDKLTRQRAAISNRETRDSFFGLGGRRKKTRARRGTRRGRSARMRRYKGGSHCSSHKQKSKTRRHKKRKNKSTRRR